MYVLIPLQTLTVLYNWLVSGRSLVRVLTISVFQFVFLCIQTTSVKKSYFSNQQIERYYREAAKCCYFEINAPISSLITLQKVPFKKHLWGPREASKTPRCLFINISFNMILEAPSDAGALDLKILTMVSNRRPPSIILVLGLWVNNC